MTLAVMIVLGACLLSPAATAPLQDAQQPQNEPSTSQSQTPPPSKPDVPEEKQAQPSATQPSATQEKPPASSEPSVDKSTKTKKQSKKNKTAKETTPPAPAQPVPSNDAPKVVVKEGSTPEPTVQLSQGIPENEISKQTQDTEQLLSKTDGNLKKIAALQLNDSQQDLVKQIYTYMDQAKAAVSAGDMLRGHTLANKAHLLSEDLLKR